MYRNHIESLKWGCIPWKICSINWLWSYLPGYNMHSHLKHCSTLLANRWILSDFLCSIRKNSFWSFALEGPCSNHYFYVPKNDTHFLTITYKLQEFMGCPSDWSYDCWSDCFHCVGCQRTLYLEVPLIYWPFYTWHWFCPKNVGRFGGALNLLGVFILVWLTGGYIFPLLKLVQTHYIYSQPSSLGSLTFSKFSIICWSLSILWCSCSNSLCLSWPTSHSPKDYIGYQIFLSHQTVYTNGLSTPMKQPMNHSWNLHIEVFSSNSITTSWSFMTTASLGITPAISCTSETLLSL